MNAFPPALAPSCFKARLNNRPMYKVFVLDSVCTLGVHALLYMHKVDNNISTVTRLGVVFNLNISVQVQGWRLWCTRMQ